MFTNEIPKEILPFKNRRECKNKRKTALCTFQDDREVYYKLFNLENDLAEWKEYLACIVFDLSPRIEWKTELQKFNICLNQMAAIYLALKDVKLIANLRIGGEDTFCALQSYPSGFNFAGGKIRGYQEKGKAEADKYKSGWKSVNLNYFVKKFAPGTKGTLSKNGRKVLYTNKKEGLQVIVDVKGLYCRLRDLNNHTRRPYLDINGNNANNYTNKNGKTKGRIKEDYEKVTHFRIFKNKDKEKKMEIKYICTINFPKKGEEGSVFSMPSGVEKNRKLITLNLMIQKSCFLGLKC